MGYNDGMRSSMLAVLLATRALAAPLLEAFVGASHSEPGDIHLVQAGAPDATVPATWDSDAFVSPPYWAVRGGWSFTTAELSLELVHHKLLMRPGVEPVQQFAITHGFNLVLASFASRLDGGMLLRAGAGVVVAHPESTVRGRTYGYGGGDFSGFVLAGPAASGGIEKRWWLARWFALCAELAFSAAWVRVPIVDGHADLSDFAVHVRLGAAVVRSP